LEYQEQCRSTSIVLEVVWPGEEALRNDKFYFLNVTVFSV